MSDFDWLRKIVEQRTPGKWVLRENTICSDWNTGYPAAAIVTVRQNMPTEFINDGGFIVTMGTLADKMLAVIEAAQKITRDYQISELRELKRTVDALRAAKAEVEK